MIVAAAAGPARAEPLRPVTTQLGWTVDLDAFLQVDAIPWSQHSFDDIDPATGQPLNETTIFVRRAFFRAEARKDRWYAETEFDGNTVAGPTARLVTTNLAWSYPGPTAEAPLLTIDGGLMQIPFGAGVPLNARYRTFVEQPTFLRAMFPGDDDAGLHVSGAFGMLRWSVAAMDGAPVADAQWKGRDPSESFDLIGRLGAVVHLPHHGRMEAGVSALTGRGLSPGVPATKDQIEWNDENQDGVVQPTEIQVIPGMPALPSQTFHHDALGADLAVHWCLRGAGHGVASFEGALATNLDRGVIYADPIRASRDFRELGYDLALVQNIGPHVTAGVRYDRYDADRDANQQAGVTIVRVHATYATLAVMAALRDGTKRLIVEYDHNQNPLGIGANGLPTTSERDRVTVRGQVEF